MDSRKIWSLGIKNRASGDPWDKNSGMWTPKCRKIVRSDDVDKQCNVSTG